MMMMILLLIIILLLLLFDEHRVLGTENIPQQQILYPVLFLVFSTNVLMEK